MFLILCFSGTDGSAACSLVQPRYPAELLVRASSIEATKGGILSMKKNIWRAVIEVSFIIFLFYSNLLTGEFERSGMGVKRGVVWAYVVFEFLRKRF